MTKQLYHMVREHCNRSRERTWYLVAIKNIRRIETRYITRKHSNN